MIKNFYEGQVIPFEFLLIRDIQLKTSANGSTYLAAKLQDTSGVIDMKYWDYSGDITSADNGTVVKVAGNITSYRGTLQFTAQKIRKATKDDSYDMAVLVPMAPIDIEATAKSLKNKLNTIQDNDYLTVCCYLLEKYQQQFLSMPAAKGVHHAFIGGLLMHTYNMMELADSIAAIYPEVNRDLLIAGTFSHDVSKINEYITSDLGLATEYSMSGHMLGHLVMGAMEVRQICFEYNIPEDKSLMLQNMLLSHHGRPEYGAATTPSTLEAELLHMIDYIDSRVEICRELFENVSIGAFSEKCFALDNHQIYRHK